MARPTAGNIYYDADADRPRVDLRSGSKKLLTEDDSTAVAAHHTSHENGGTDEISVAGLSGVLADNQVAGSLDTSGSAVNVDAAAPPSAGQVLTATDATHATWQTPSAVVLNSVKSNFWYPPDSVHASDVEFDSGGGLGPWGLVETATWTTITPVAAVSQLSSPSAGTFRKSVNLKRSYLSLQPALGYNIGLKQTFNASARPGSCQFSTRVNFPVPYAAATGDTNFTFALCADVAGNPDFSANFFYCQLIQASGNTVLRTAFRSGSSNFNLIDTAIGYTPLDFELILACSSTLMLIFVRGNGFMHSRGSLTMATMTQTNKQHLVVSIGTTSSGTSPMPFAPIYHIDYLRQIDTADVF